MGYANGSTSNTQGSAPSVSVTDTHWEDSLGPAQTLSTQLWFSAHQHQPTTNLRTSPEAQKMASCEATPAVKQLQLGKASAIQCAEVMSNPLQKGLYFRLGVASLKPAPSNPPQLQLISVFNLHQFCILHSHLEVNYLYQVRSLTSKSPCTN